MEELESGKRKEVRKTTVEGDVFKGGKIITTTKIKDELGEGVKYFNTIITTSTAKVFETFYIVDTKKTPEAIVKEMVLNMFGKYNVEPQYANRGAWSGFYITPKFQDRVVIAYSMLKKDLTEYEYALKFAPIVARTLKAPLIMMARERYSNCARAISFSKKGKQIEELQFKTAHDASEVLMKKYKISVNDLYMNLMNRINAEQHRIKYMNGGMDIGRMGFSRSKMKGVSYDQFKFHFPNIEPEAGKVIEQFWFDPFQEVKK